MINHELPKLYSEAMQIVRRGGYEPVTKEFYASAYAAFLTSAKVEYKEKCQFVAARKIPLTKETFLAKFKHVTLGFVNTSEFAE